MTNQQLPAIEDMIPGIGDALQRLLFSMLDQGERRGVLHIRPAIDGAPVNYELQFAVTATMVPDSEKRSKPRTAKGATKDRERRGYRRLNA